MTAPDRLKRMMPTIREIESILEFYGYIMAKSKANSWANKYTSRSPYFGKKFKMGGEEFLFVVVDAAQPKWGLKAVRISDGNKMRLHVRVQREIAAQIKG